MSRFSAIQTHPSGDRGKASTDPGFGTAFTVTDLNAAIDFNFPAAPVLLVQSSQNIGSAGLGGPLDVTIPGVYDFRLTVLDGDTALARTAMRVIVGQVSEPMTPCCSACSARRRRRA